MASVISARNVSKRYGDKWALNGLNLEVKTGQIVGLIGPNGAGKTTALRCLLGLATYDGSLTVLGQDPARHRLQLLEKVAYIADTAVLPRWITVAQILQHIDGVHPKFDRARALSFLEQTEIRSQDKVGTLSKGMVTQLHLALAISIDAQLLVLDEPTLGLDIVYRKRFYQQLLNDYFDEERTIVITTHQVEEVESLLTNLVFMQHGRVVLDMPMEELSERFLELEVNSAELIRAQALHPISSRKVLGGEVLLFEGVSAEQLVPFGRVRTPSVADLFVAKMSDDFHSNTSFTEKRASNHA